MQENKIYLDKSNNFFECLNNHKIGLVIGTHSTALMESWIVGVPSLAIKCSFDYGSHLWKDGLIEICGSIEIFRYEVKKCLEMTDRDIENKTKSIWNKDVYINKEKAQNVLLGINV